MEIDNNCKKCGRPLKEGEGVNGLCDKCLIEPWDSDDSVELTNAESVLRIISTIILIVGVIFSIIFAAQITKDFSIEGLVGTITIFLFSICFWALLSCLIGMSVNLREIAKRKK